MLTEYKDVGPVKGRKYALFLKMCPWEGSIFRTFLHQFLSFSVGIFSGKVKVEPNWEIK